MPPSHVGSMCDRFRHNNDPTCSGPAFFAVIFGQAQKWHLFSTRRKMLCLVEGNDRFLYDSSPPAACRQPAGIGRDAQLGPSGRPTQQEPFAGRSREKSWMAKECFMRMYLKILLVARHHYADFNIRQDDGSCLEPLKNWKIGILGQMRGLPQLRPHKSGAPGPGKP